MRRATTYQPTPTVRLHHLQPGNDRRLATRQVSAWPVALVMALMRRPVLALTLALTIILLISTFSEANAANHLETQTHAAQQQNAALQGQLTQTAQQIQARTVPDAIERAAQRLGWVMATPQP